MILKRLTLKNFKQFGQFDLQFQEGLVGIVGKNGAGKSTIFEAILLCLFGSNNTDKAYYKSAWAGPKKEVSLQLAFELQQKYFTVVRSFRGKVMSHHAQLFDHSDQLIATSANVVNGKIAELMGMDKEAFTRSVFSGQKELGAISNARGEERKKMVRKMIGLNNLDRIQDIIRKDRNDTRKHLHFQLEGLWSEDEIAEIKRQRKTLKARTGQSQKRVKAQQKSLTASEKALRQAAEFFDAQFAKQKTFQSIKDLLIKCHEKVEHLEERSKAVDKQLQELEKLQTKLGKQSAAMQTYEKEEQRKEELERLKSQFDEQQQLLARKKNYEEKIAEFKGDVAALQMGLKPYEGLNRQLINTKKTLEARQLQKRKLQQEQLLRQSDYGAIDGRIRDREKQLDHIRALGKEANCPTCYQPLVAVYESTLQKLKEDIQRFESKEKSLIRSRLRQLEEQIEELSEKIREQQEQEGAMATKIELLQKDREKIAEWQQRIDHARKLCKELEDEIKQYGNIRFDPDQLEALRLSLRKRKEAYIAYRSDVEKVEQINDYRQERAELSQRIAKGREFILLKERELEKLNFSEQQFEQAKIRREEAELKRSEGQSRLNELEKELMAEEQQLHNLEKTIHQYREAQAAIGKKKEELSYLEELDGLFSAFKTYILEKVRPTISGEASQLFERITGGRYDGIMVDDNFEFHIYESGVAYPITRFSGGEIDLANFCLRIGISKAISELSGRGENLGFLGFDEVFGSQDEERRFGILHALEYLKEQYQQIYIISHIDSVKQHFPHILQVRKTHRGSEAEWR